MTVALWRIAAEQRTHPANDMSGTGAGLLGGRWNSPGTRMVYSSTTVSLAILESVVHLRLGSLPFNRYLVRVDVPDTVWDRREMLSLPAGWDSIPDGMVGRRAGDAWISTNRSPLLVVPSVIVPEESNVLINPSHPDARAIVASTVRKWIYDPRLF